MKIYKRNQKIKHYNMENQFALKYSISKDFLIKQYIKNKKSALQTAKELDIKPKPIYYNLIRYNIPRRHRQLDYPSPFKGKKLSKKSKQKMSLSHGGTGIPYENNDYPKEYAEIRLKILKRDNYICQLCFEYGNEVHHIDYNKNNNEESNLICLCRRCNIKANYSRDYWFAYFTYIIKNSLKRGC